MNAPNCLTCNVTMQLGFIPDLAHGSTPTEPTWTEGKPVVSFWYGLKLEGHERIPVATYRCPRCGLLQSYANHTE